MPTSVIPEAWSGDTLYIVGSIWIVGSIIIGTINRLDVKEKK